MFSPCKITVIRRSLDRELIAEYLDAERSDMDRCEVFTDGQEFAVTTPYVMPEGFCSWAWCDIRDRVLLVASGGTIPGRRRTGVEVASCSDLYRPVVFRIERVE